MKAWNELSMSEKADVMKLAIEGGVYDLDSIRSGYNKFAEGGDTNPGMTGMMKSKLATAAHFGNPTARRMTNYDTRSYTWPGEYEYDNGIGEPKRGNVFVGSYGNLVTPQIQDTGKELTFIEDIWSPENDRRSFMQSLKFNNEKDARYFGEHYKEIAPMMNLYNDGGHKIHIKPENRGKFTALKERTGHSATWFKEHGTPAQKKMATFALNARKWKHGDGGNLYAHGGELGNYYDGWGDAWNSLKKGYYDTKAKAKKAIKDLGLDRGPIEHIVNRAITASKDIRDNRNSELSIPVSLVLNAGRVMGINKAIKGSDNDTQYRQNLYNLIDPTNAIPESFGRVADYAKAVRKAKSGDNYSYRRKHEDKAADAAWAKRLGLPYDSTILISNPDGSVHLAEYLENEIPTDTTFIKTRIADNEKLRNKTYGPDRGKIEAALNIDKAALDSLRHTYKTGEPVEMNEFSHINRHLFNNGETTPLNLLHRYTLQYNKDNNTMDYKDVYDFDGFEDYIPGNPFNIRGSINLSKRK